jgi:hypothetical protein
MASFNPMRPSIRELYAYAVSEGEGVGTAYEYYVKRRIMRSVLRGLRPGARVLIAGLPEKYGTSLDFVLAAFERRAHVLVVDDRQAALDRARDAIGTLRAGFAGLEIEYLLLDSLAEMKGLPRQDLVLSCEVIQRMSPAAQAEYGRAIVELGPRGVVFAPNAENGSHTAISGLAGLDRATLRAVMGPHVRHVEVGFTDLPPFPPGITRTPSQRTRASRGALEGIGMWGLQLYSAAEPWLPDAVKRRVAHIVYAKWPSGDASAR